MMTSPLTTPRRIAGIVLVAVALAFTGACSGTSTTTAGTTTLSPEAKYCAAWSNLVTSFSAYNQIDVINGGLDSVRSYFDRLDAAAKELQSSADSQLKPSVDAFVTSLDTLGQTVTSGSLPVDRRAQVKAARQEVDSAWNTLITKAKASCPSVTGTTVGS